MPSTRGFAARRRGLRDARLPPVRIFASTDVSVQHGEAFRPARSHAGYTIDIALQGPTGVEAWATCDVNGTPSNGIHGPRALTRGAGDHRSRGAARARDVAGGHSLPDPSGDLHRQVLHSEATRTRPILGPPALHRPPDRTRRGT
jgi:hypothetical protein